jgi:glutathione S-transferase
MKLYGTVVSPYVRRIRLFLGANDLTQASYQFSTMDIFSAQGRSQLIAQNPSLKVPYLIDNEQSIYDSGVIFRYLSQKFDQAPLSWDQENLLTLIDAANDSFVSLLLCGRSGLDSSQDLLFLDLQNERVKTLLTELDLCVSQGKFEQWQYPAMALYCLLDWLNFRELYSVQTFEHLTQFIQESQNQPQVQLTDPRS